MDPSYHDPSTVVLAEFIVILDMNFREDDLFKYPITDFKQMNMLIILTANIFTVSV
jgi:hypothetical protein